MRGGLVQKWMLVKTPVWPQWNPNCRLWSARTITVVMFIPKGCKTWLFHISLCLFPIHRTSLRSGGKLSYTSCKILQKRILNVVRVTFLAQTVRLSNPFSTFYIMILPFDLLITNAQKKSSDSSCPGSLTSTPYPINYNSRLQTFEEWMVTVLLNLTNMLRTW